MIQRRRKTRMWLWWVIFAVVLIGAGAVACWLWKGYVGDHGKIDEVEVSVVKNTETGVEEENNREDELEVSTEVEIEKPKVTQYEGESPNRSEELTGVVTYAGVTGGILRIRVNIDQYLETGSCKLALMSGGVTVYNSAAGIVGSATTASCEGFDVPVTGLPNGAMEIAIGLEAEGKIGEIRGEVEI